MKPIQDEIHSGIGRMPLMDIRFLSDELLKVLRNKLDVLLEITI